MAAISELEVGFARAEITPPVGSPLADAPFGAVLTGKGRFSSRLRDPLFARALHFRTRRGEATLVVGDILLITSPLQSRVAELAGIDPESLVLAATHTHSGPGGYWDAGRAQRIVGEYQQSLFDRIAGGLAEAARGAREDLRPARMFASETKLVGVSSNRRRLLGPVDPDLTLLRFEREQREPIDLVSFGAHPVIGQERALDTISADFPGELCGRLDRRGVRSLFFQGSVGGLSPLFPEFPMTFDDHLELVGGLLERGWEAAVQKLESVEVTSLEARRVTVALGPVSCRFFPRKGFRFGAAELAFAPIRRWLTLVSQEGRRTEPDAKLHLLRLGQAALLGTPCDLGVTVGLALKQALRDAGLRFPIVGSQCGGYVGYVHLPEDYEHVPEPGFRELAYYENGMSVAGWGLGQDFVEAMHAALAGSVARTAERRV